MPLPGLPKLTTPQQSTLPEPGVVNPTQMGLGLALAGMAQGITNQNTLGLAVAELERQRHRLAQTQAMNLGIENQMAEMEANTANTVEKLKYDQGMGEHKRVTGEAHDKAMTKLRGQNASKAKIPEDKPSAFVNRDLRSAAEEVDPVLDELDKQVASGKPFEPIIFEDEDGEVQFSLDTPAKVRSYVRSQLDKIPSKHRGELNTRTRRLTQLLSQLAYANSGLPASTLLGGEDTSLSKQDIMKMMK